MEALERNDEQLNLSAIDGVRSLACFSVVLLHVYLMEGGLFFLSNDPAMQAIRDVPIFGPLVFSISFQMTLFWLLSGFLCERQLDYLRREYGKGKLRIQAYARFLANRLLRLYPLYFSMALLMFWTRSLIPNRTEAALCEAPVFLQTLVFIMPSDYVPVCAGVGWSVMTDVHGYLVITSSFAFFSSYAKGTTYRKGLLWSIYGLSILLLYKISASGGCYDSSTVGGLASFGPLRHYRESLSLEYMPREELHVLDVLDFDVQSLYQDFDFDAPDLAAFRIFSSKMLKGLYYTSVFKHGSSTLLGSLLYQNLRDRCGQPSHVLFKLIAAAAVQYLTSAHFAYSGICVYLVMDVVLTAKPAFKMFSNKLWAALAPYTYGIFMVHSLIIADGIQRLFTHRAEMLARGENPGDDFTLGYIFLRALKVFIQALIASVILHFTIEYPFNFFRQKYVCISASKNRFD